MRGGLIKGGITFLVLGISSLIIYGWLGFSWIFLLVFMGYLLLIIGPIMLIVGLVAPGVDSNRVPKVSPPSRPTRSISEKIIEREVVLVVCPYCGLKNSQGQMQCG